jgi:hypothetical protein
MIFKAILLLLVIDILLLTHYKHLVYTAPRWMHWVPGGILYAFIFRRDLLKP